MVRSRSLAFALPIVLLLVVAGLGGSGGLLPSVRAAGAPSYTVGVSMPMSGPNAFVGQENVNAIKLAINEANASGKLPGHATLTLDIKDDQYIPNVGVSAMQRMINEDHVIAVLGPFGSDVTAAVGPIANAAHIPMLVAGATAARLSQQGWTYFFRANDNDTQQGTLFMKYVIGRLHWTRVVMVHVQNDWGNGLLQFVNKTETAADGHVVGEFSYVPGTTDFLSMVTRIKALQFDGIVTASLNTEMAALVRQATQAGIPGSKFAAFGADPAQLVKLVQKDANGVYFATYYDAAHPANPVAARFVKSYQATYGSLPTTFAAQGYNASTMLIAAIIACGSYDPQKIGPALHQLRNVPTVFGPLTFDAQGQASHGIVVQQIRNEKAVPVGTSM
ncbi:MAG TPA: branched-chain amino acid ABC transporter substrate-binding protein [bacterium]|nr:branched-chain amino acid ABC transporter substrate-binding protein [bacterium]